MNAHNIVTNSYSCGIGELNLFTLMMGNNLSSIISDALTSHLSCLSC